jgi:hypothetical protein
MEASFKTTFSKIETAYFKALAHVSPNLLYVWEREAHAVEQMDVMCRTGHTEQKNIWWRDGDFKFSKKVFVDVISLEPFFKNLGSKTIFTFDCNVVRTSECPPVLRASCVAMFLLKR